MFKNILLDLLAEKGISQRKLSKEADIPTTTISGWINAGRLPDYHAIRKLALYFNVSADYLLELTTIYESPKTYYTNNITTMIGNINQGKKE